MWVFTRGFRILNNKPQPLTPKRNRLCMKDILMTDHPTQMQGYYLF